MRDAFNIVILIFYYIALSIPYFVIIMLLVYFAYAT